MNEEDEEEDGLAHLHSDWRSPGGIAQTLEDEGIVVDFAGLKIIGVHNLLGSRYLNPHCEYSDDGTAHWKQKRYRVAAGSSERTFKGRVGQMMGLIARVIDSANAWNGEWVVVDLVFLWMELSNSGWSRDEFFIALSRLVSGSPNLGLLEDCVVAMISWMEQTK